MRAGKLSAWETILRLQELLQQVLRQIDRDGGYVLAQLDGGYDCYISCGVCSEESFSRDFIMRREVAE